MNVRSLRRVASRLNVSKSSLQRWIQNIDKRRKRRSCKQVQVDVKRCIDDTLKARPFTTMQTLCQDIVSQCGIRMSPSTAARVVKRVGWSHKKAFRVIDKKHTRETLENFKHAYLESTDDSIVCIDEAGFYIGDIPRYGYAPRGRRLNVPCDRCLRRSKITLLMAISKDGVVAYELLAHNCKRDDFVNFIEHLDVPKGTRVVMDNVAFHHSKVTKDALQAKDISPLYIPAYSPRFNAIEYVFSQLKSDYRKRCPVYASKTFDYQAQMHRSISSISSNGFSKIFEHVCSSVREILTSHDASFSGYD